jgi:hypothetical protein
VIALLLSCGVLEWLCEISSCVCVLSCMQILPMLMVITSTAEWLMLGCGCSNFSPGHSIC